MEGRGRTALLALSLCLALPSSAAAAEREILIRGATVVTMDRKHHVIKRGRVLIDGNRIAAIWAPGKRPKGVSVARLRRATTVESGRHELLFPGLINLHDHPSYSALHAWPAPSSHAIPGAGKAGPDPYDNRYEWNTGGPEELARLVSNPERALDDPGALDLGADAVKYAEVQGLLGGETSIQGAARDPATAGVGSRNIESDVFNTRIAEPRVAPIASFGGAALASFAAALNGGAYDAWMVHLAEGVRDADRRPGDTVSSRAEFQALVSKGLLSAATVILHGVALERPDFAAMRAAGSDLVWSPRSNLQLYGRTTDVYEAIAEGVRVSLGTDWTPSGSAGLLGELAVASRALLDDRVLGGSRSLVKGFVGRRGRLRLDRSLVDMVTRNPALSLRWERHVGSIRRGMRADLLLIHDPEDGSRRGKDKIRRSPNAYRALIDATEANVRLVTVDGEPVVAGRRLMRSLSPADYELVPGALGGRVAIDLTEASVPGGTDTVAQVTARLGTALAALGGDSPPPGGGPAPLTNTYSHLKATWAGGALAGLSDADFRNVLEGYFGTDGIGRLNIEGVALKPLVDRDDDFLGHLMDGDLSAGLIADPTPPFAPYPANLNHVGPAGNPLAGLP
jgi:5-methylthioadenosine/S-adenosylhomocysteine deaminase